MITRIPLIEASAEEKYRIDSHFPIIVLIFVNFSFEILNNDGEPEQQNIEEEAGETANNGIEQGVDEQVVDDEFEQDNNSGSEEEQDPVRENLKFELLVHWTRLKEFVVTKVENTIVIARNRMDQVENLEEEVKQAFMSLLETWKSIVHEKLNEIQDAVDSCAQNISDLIKQFFEYLITQKREIDERLDIICLCRR